jgi:hypothetical protein
MILSARIQLARWRLGYLRWVIRRHRRAAAVHMARAKIADLEFSRAFGELCVMECER